MNDPLIEVSATRTIRRPIDVVRAQFFDFDHHIRKDVHHGTVFTILERGTDRVRLRVETRLAGMKQVDEWLVHRLNDGNLLHSFVAGKNSGGGIEVKFRPDGPETTVVDARVFLPKRGIKRLLAPLFRSALRKIGETSLDEDVRDLESGGYPSA